MDIRVGDTLLMKKQHPCGSRRWLVLRTGADFRLRCEGCGRDYPTVQFGRTCPHCGSEKTWLKQGSEINLKEIEAI